MDYYSFGLILVLWFFFVNCLSYVLMFVDKRRALNGNWRISEGQLLIWCLLGGSVGGKLGQKAFRHKTQKQPFATILNVYLALNVIAYCVLATQRGRDTAYGVMIQFLL